MSSQLPSGPYRKITLDDGTQVPYYIIPFDQRGLCEGPETRQHLLNALQQGDFTDIFLFSHGWNNDWTVATERYEHFLNGYIKMRNQKQLAISRPYRPLLVGIFWPSTALLWTASEIGPDIAASDPDAMDASVAAERREVCELADELSPEQAERFYALIQKQTLTEQDALALASLVQAFYSADDEVSGDHGGILSAEQIVKLWAAATPTPPNLDDFGTVGGAADKPQAAGFTDILKKLDPRQIIRTLTVSQMKDRAGKVGATGVRSLLADMLSASATRLHLIGHSYGGKVMLSALGAGGELPRQVNSLLLLQPAVSHLCFAENVPSVNRPGGYHAVLNRVKQPILSTFSRHDFPLTRIFHLALRRDADLAEAQIAGPGEPPSRYAALGGFGPRGCGEQLIAIKSWPESYTFDPGIRIYGLRGDSQISGHGDISNAATWWALYNLVTA